MNLNTAMKAQYGSTAMAKIRAEVPGKICGGRKVSQVAGEYGMNELTIRTWLERDAKGGKGLR